MIRRVFAAFRRAAGRLGVRLLLLHLVVILVPVAGIELARLVEHQLLDSLERDMKNQAALTRAFLEDALAEDSSRDPAEVLGRESVARTLRAAARTTRTRLRVLDRAGQLASDSHAGGPPEGPEAAPPSVLPTRDRAEGSGARTPPDERWPDLPERTEVRAALQGSPATRTRVRDRDPGVLLFLATPVRARGEVVGVIYVTRSTQPVLVELYRIRSGLLRVLAVAFLFTGALVLLLALSVSRPLARLSRAAKRIASGELHVEVPIGGSGEVRDLSEAFAAMKEQLDRRLRYVSELAADVAHEFKSPLTSIRGASELLVEGAAEDPEARTRFLRNISLDVDRLDRLVTRLLILSRIEASREPLLPVDLAELAEEVALRTHTAENDVVVEVPDGLDPTVSGRRADLDTALGNLVENAVHASPAGEPVVVRIEPGPRPASLSVIVMDAGKGIPASIRPRIFERFFTTDPDRGGTGLGLAIVQSVAEAHGGSVDCTPGPEGGMRFTLTLPRKRSGLTVRRA